MALGDFLGGVAGGFTDTSRTIGNQQYQQGLLKLDQQRLQMAEQARQREQLEKAREQMWGVLQTGLEHAAEADPKNGVQQFMMHSKGLIDALRTNYGIDGPESAKAFEGMLSGLQVGAANKLAAMQATTQAKETPAQAELRSAQAQHLRDPFGLGAGTPSGAGYQPPGQNLTDQNAQVIDVQDVPPGQPLPGTKASPFKTPIDPTLSEFLQKRFMVSPQQFDFEAEQLAQGNKDVLTGSGRGGKEGEIYRRGLQARAAQYWIEKGVPASVANAAVIEFQARKKGAGSLATVEARVTGAIEKAKAVAPLIESISEALPRTEYPTLNKLLLSGRTQVGNVDVPRLKVALETLASNYGSALGMGNSVLTDFQTKRAQELIEIGYSHGQLKAAVNQILVEMDRELAGTQRGLRTYLGTEGGGKQPKADDPLGIR